MPQHDKTHVTSNAKRAPSWGSTPRPYTCEAHALPTELRRHFMQSFMSMELIVQSNIGIGTSSCSGWKLFAPFIHMLLDSMTPSSRPRASRM